MTVKYQTLKKHFYCFWLSYIYKRNAWWKDKRKKIVDYSDISSLVKNSCLNTNLSTLTTKEESKVQKDKIVKLQVFDSSYFHGKSHLEDNRSQSY